MMLSRKKLSGLLFPVFGALFTGPVGCAADGLIGGECAPGYAFCSAECISVTDDELNCGGCDVACPRNLACIDAICGGPDGTITVPGSGGSGAANGTGGIGFGGINVGAGGPDEGETGGGAPVGGGDGTGAGVGTGGGGPVCVPPFNSAEFCGDCDTTCRGGTPNCAPDGNGGYECVATCLTAPFLTECGTVCVDPDSDPRHCGSCNNRCDSGICAAGTCVGKLSGHMVALCMSFETLSTSQTNLLGNAVFLAASNPARILAYTRDSTAASISGTNVALATAAAARGQSFQKTEVTGLNSVSTRLSRTDFDVLIVYDQQEAPAGRMAALAASWGPAVQSFTQVGGVVVILTGGGGVSETHELVDGLGLAATSGTTNYDGDSFDLIAPGDALAIGLISPFLGVPTSCVFSGTSPAFGDLVYVTEGGDPGPGQGDPGVLHRVVVP